jgi:hypothetical protein
MKAGLLTKSSAQDISAQDLSVLLHALPTSSASLSGFNIVHEKRRGSYLYLQGTGIPDVKLSYA